MAKVLGLKQLLQKKYKLLEGLNDSWQQALGLLEEVFVMLVWGQSSHGKSSFLMQLIREVSRFGIVLYVGLEEGHTLTMQKKAKDFLSDEQLGRVRFADHSMTFEELVQHLKKKKQAKYIIIDSVQYFNITYDHYKSLKQHFPKKSFIFISHAKGKTPDGKTADKIRYDAGLKVRVEGFIAFVGSRYGGSKNYVVWEEGAKRYWGKAYKKHLNR